MNERKKQQQYADMLNKQVIAKENAKKQEEIESKYEASSSSISLPSERSAARGGGYNAKANQVSPAIYRQALRRSPTKEVMSKKENLVQQYELESRLQKDLLRVDEEKRQRIADVQNQRKKEELERLQEKNRRQHEYMSALKEQQVSFPRF